MKDRITSVDLECAERLLSEGGIVLSKGRFCDLPHCGDAVELINKVKSVVYPRFFSDEDKPCKLKFAASCEELKKLLERCLTSVFSYEYERLGRKFDEKTLNEKVLNTANAFLEKLPDIVRDISLDVKATLNGDPAAENADIILMTYAGVEATFTYRVAHVLYLLGVPYLPRMMNEHAHSVTGIDINPGATIGKSFVIDHGTGVVIGETTVIGDRVKIYQGVTLGAKSLADARGLVGVKRHPTVGNDVTIYSGATVLGGNTVIGNGAVLGSNVFITSSVPDNVTVAIEKPRLRLYKNNPLD